MKVVPLLFGSSLVVLTNSQTVGRIHTTYINGDQSLGAAFQQQPIALAQPFQQQLHFQSAALPTYTQSLHPIQVQQSIAAPINVVSHHAVAVPIPISQQLPQTRVLALQANPINQVQILHQDEPPRFNRVAIKNRKVQVLDVQKPAIPPMTVFQVRRAPNPPTTIEFVSERQTEPQVTVFDDTNNAVRVENVEDEEEEDEDEEENEVVRARQEDEERILRLRQLEEDRIQRQRQLDGNRISWQRQQNVNRYIPQSQPNVNRFIPQSQQNVNRFVPQRQLDQNRFLRLRQQNENQYIQPRRQPFLQQPTGRQISPLPGNRRVYRNNY